MARVQKKFVLAGTRTEEPSDVARSFQVLDQMLEDLFRAVNAVDLGTAANQAVPGQLSGRYLVYTSNAVADTDDTVRHTLGRVPVGMLNVEVPILPGATPNSGRVYWGSALPTDKVVTLRCTTASKRAAVIIW